MTLPELCAYADPGAGNANVSFSLGTDTSLPALITSNVHTRPSGGSGTTNDVPPSPGSFTPRSALPHQYGTSFVFVGTVVTAPTSTLDTAPNSRLHNARTITATE